MPELLQSSVTLWLIAALALFGAELLSGTFYLLVFAVGCVAAALLAFIDAPIAAQLAACAAFSAAGAFAVRRMRLQNASSEREAEQLQNIDAGQTVQVDRWEADGTASVTYRGTVWKAAAASGAVRRSGAYVIARVDGTRLILLPAPSTLTPEK